MSFGVQGWTWGDQRPSAITFFLDGTCKVSDQHGRPIKGVVKDGHPALFSRMTHAQVIVALLEERVDVIEEMNKAGQPCKKCQGTGRAGEVSCMACVGTGRLQTLVCAGWPQLPYEELLKVKELPPTPVEELRKIKDPDLRRDALRARREFDAAREKEFQATEEE